MKNITLIFHTTFNNISANFHISKLTYATQLIQFNPHHPAHLPHTKPYNTHQNKVLFYNELYQLPPIRTTQTKNRTTIAMLSYKPLNKLSKEDRILACYQHACLRFISNEKMTNQTLRKRFKINDKNASIASRIIKEALEKGTIKENDPESLSKKYKSYVPYWA